MVLALVACGCVGRPTRVDFREVVQAAKDKVFPAVIFVKCLQETHETGKKITREAAGSGVIISPKGEALTNWHVVHNAVEVRCLLLNGQAMSAKVVGTDKDTDLALIQLELAKGTEAVPFAELGDSQSLKEGDFVMAMGAPWGLTRSVSIGIISCTRRFLPMHSEYSLWLQTDASISPGNSGGPLVDTDGRIVGINTRTVMRGGDIGFAIPSQTIRLMVPRLRKHKKANWSWTGLQLQPLKDFNKNIYFKGSDGVIVAETDPDSPAREAKIRAEDRIMAINGRPLRGEREEELPLLRQMLGLLPKNKPAVVELRRNGKTVVVRMTPRQKGKVEGDELDCPRWDMTVKAINQFDNPDLHFYRKKGVFVYGVRYPGNASRSGLCGQDILLEIDGKKVTTLGELKAIHAACLKSLKTKHRVLVVILRNGLTRQVVLDFARDFEKD